MGVGRGWGGKLRASKMSKTEAGGPEAAGDPNLSMTGSVYKSKTHRGSQDQRGRPGSDCRGISAPGKESDLYKQREPWIAPCSGNALGSTPRSYQYSWGTQEFKGGQETLTPGAGLQDTNSFASHVIEVLSASQHCWVPSPIFLASHFQAVLPQEWTDRWLSSATMSLTTFTHPSSQVPLFLPGDIKARESSEVCLTSPSRLT